MRVIGLKKMIGLPIIFEEKNLGNVLRGVLSEDGKSLRGIVIRGGMKGERWLPREKISLIGQFSVIADGKPQRLPRDSDYHLFRVTDEDGARLGIVTDALLQNDTLRVAALEISAGPLDDLFNGRWFATNFSVRSLGGTGHVTIPSPGEEVKKI